jgi:hypothetical protein
VGTSSVDFGDVKIIFFFILTEFKAGVYGNVDWIEQAMNWFR